MQQLLEDNEVTASPPLAPGEKLPAPVGTEDIQLAIVNGLKPGGNLREGRMVSMAPGGVGLVFHGKMNFDQWRQLLQFLKEVKSQFHFAFADTIKYGRENYTEELVKEAITTIDFDHQDLLRAEAISVLPHEHRTSNLTSEHHYIAAKVENMGELEKWGWLETAVKENLSALELAHSIEAGKVTKMKTSASGQGRGAGIASIEGVRFMFQAWSRQVQEHDPIETWDRERKERWLEEVKPIEETIKMVRESLAAEEVDQTTVTVRFPLANGASEVDLQA